MKNEMTEVDIRKIQEELHHRKNVLGPELHAEVKRTREYGDLSENAEYKQAKYERNRNESRIRYLEGLLRTAIVVRDNPHRRGIGLLDYVEYLNERTGTVRRIQLVTSIRQDARFSANTSASLTRIRMPGRAGVTSRRRKRKKVRNSLALATGSMERTNGWI